MATEREAQEVGATLKNLLSDEALGRNKPAVTAMSAEMQKLSVDFCGLWPAGKTALQALKALVLGSAWWEKAVMYLLGLIIDRVIAAGDSWATKHCPAPGPKM